MISLVLIIFIDRKTNRLVDVYIDTEVRRLSNNLVSKVIHGELSNYNYDLLKIKYDGISDNKENISYDIAEINKLTNEINNKIQKKMSDLDDGDLGESGLISDSKRKRFKHIKNGIVCDLSIGSIRNSLLFANISPTIPIKIVFLSQTNVDVDVQTKEYGINNIMVTMYLRVTLHEQITMPISSKRKKVIIEEPLLVDIVRGEIPYLYDKRIGE